MTKPKYNCGDRASTIIGAIEGIITAMTIRGSNITYEFSTVVSGEPRSFWVSEHEITPKVIETKPAGFKSE
jgi:hypothetical protein